MLHVSCRKANEDLLRKLYNSTTPDQTSNLLKLSDPHTAYFFNNGFTFSSPPDYKKDHKVSQESCLPTPLNSLTSWVRMGRGASGEEGQGIVNTLPPVKVVRTEDCDEEDVDNPEIQVK